MPPAPDLARLRDFFEPADVEWKPGAVTRDKKKALAMAYLTNRAVQDRLDAVCGPENWKNAYRPGPDGGVLCGIAINVTGDPLAPRWVTKWDGAENTEFESVKGGLSGAMKRAAVMWGIGRYLYDLPSVWVPLDERGRFAETPRIPAAFLPRAPRPIRRAEPAAAPPETAAPETVTPEQVQALRRVIVDREWDEPGARRVLDAHGVTRLSEVAASRFEALYAELDRGPVAEA